MYLAEDSTTRALLDGEQNYNRWVEHPTSNLLHHDAECCDRARLWFLALARSMEGWSCSQFGMKSPTWLSQYFSWGPSIWPISWCQVVKEKVIDCGVFAALTREILTAQGHRVHAGQCLLSYNQTCTNHWKDLWKNKMPKSKERRPGEVFHWVGDQVVYHEVCVIECPDGNARLYDSTFGGWYEPRTRVGFGALIAARSECPRLLKWGNKYLSCGEWVDL